MKRSRKTKGLLVMVTIAMAISLLSMAVSAVPSKTNYDFDTPLLPGSKSELLLDNPDRGLRLELYLDVGRGTGVYEQKNSDAFESLIKEIEYYEEDKPKLAQVYFYITEYAERDIDQAGFDRMTRYFEILEEHDIKAVLRFTYGYTPTEGGPNGDTQASIASMQNHLEQLQPWIEAHKTQIHVMQLGLVAYWGEWGGQSCANGIVNSPANKTLIEKFLEVIPADMQLQVRYHYLKHGGGNYVDCSDLDGYERVSFHDDQLRSGFDGTGISGSSNPNSTIWAAQSEECANLLIDGEMFWGGGSNDDTSSISIAQQMQEFHFTSLSLKHNYREDNKNAGTPGMYSMENWKREIITRTDLENAFYAAKNQTTPLRYAPGWFSNEEGNNINRNMFEYIRDHLGYYLQCTNAKATVQGNDVNVTLDLTNYGFSAPHGLGEVQAVLVDSSGNVVQSEKMCELGALQPEITVPVNVNFTLPDDGRMYQIGIRLLAKDGTTGARLANDIAFYNNVNILGRLN